MNAHKQLSSLRYGAWALLILLCCGVAQAGRRSKRDTQKDQLVPSASYEPSSLWDSLYTTSDRGGIDPTTVPIIDEDLEFALQLAQLPTDGAALQLQAEDAHAVATGRGVVVAVLDGGFNLRHPDIAPGVLGAGYDAIDDDFDAQDTGNGVDDDLDGIVDRGAGHGTFVAGMVLRSAPDARILPIRIRDDEGWGTKQETLRGLRYARDMGADVINLSITNVPFDEQEIFDLLLEIVAMDVPVIVSAGNNGSTILTKGMALADFTLAVGAVDHDDVLAEFSNWSLFTPMVYAPGVDLKGPIGAPSDDTRGIWSGTSFATGFVSGAAALARELHPKWSPKEVYAHLCDAVDPVCNAWGWPLSSGRINLWKVVTN